MGRNANRLGIAGLAVASTVATCSGKSTEDHPLDPNEPVPGLAPVQFIDPFPGGIDTPFEAAELAKRQDWEGFGPLAGEMKQDGAAILWDPEQCWQTKASFANGIALRIMETISDPPAHSGIEAIDVKYLRVCGGEETDLTQVSGTVWNTRRNLPIYSALADYQRRVYSVSQIADEK